MRGSNKRNDHIRYLFTQLDVSSPDSLGRTINPKTGRVRCREAMYHFRSQRITRAVNKFIYFWLQSEDPEIRQATLELQNELRELRRKLYVKDLRSTWKERPAKPPAGATMKVPGSDGRLHWSDGVNDLGVINE